MVSWGREDGMGGRGKDTSRIYKNLAKTLTIILQLSDREGPPHFTEQGPTKFKSGPGQLKNKPPSFCHNFVKC